MDDVSIECWGPTALLVRFADSASSHSLARCRGLLTALNAAKLPPGTELVPGYGEIMIDLSDTTALAEARRVTQEAVSKARPVPADGTRLHRIPVHYDGPDLIEFADQSGLAAAEVIELHSRPVYDVFLVGFAPGLPTWGRSTRGCIVRAKALPGPGSKRAVSESAARIPASTASPPRAAGGCSGKNGGNRVRPGAQRRDSLSVRPGR